MIQDPIHLTVHPDNALFDAAIVNGKSELFFTMPLYDRPTVPIFLYLMDLTRSRQADYFVKFTMRHPKGTFSIDGGWANSKITSRSSISKEAVIDIIMAQYPDYFEWLLFHPEWLP